MADLAAELRGQFEAGVTYPTTFPGVFNTFEGSTRALALELNRAEGRPVSGRPLKSTQDQLARYRRGARSPKPARMQTLRQLARARIAGQRLAPFRDRGAGVVLHGHIRVSASRRYVRLSFALGPDQFRQTLDAAEAAMRAGRGWGRVASAFTREVLEDAYAIDQETEVLEVDAITVRPL